MKPKQNYKKKNYKTTLYPTWFRWNATVLTLGIEAFAVFISHMVQMKLEE